MKKLILVIFACFNVSLALAQDSNEPPKLVVGIVIDQMRYDYIYRFWDLYGEDGFRKLAQKGFNCTQAHYNYLGTKTAPGHATIYTGCNPSIHGICGNNWYDYSLKKSVYCVEDNTVTSESEFVKKGISPRNLKANTIGDQLKIAHGQYSKVYSLSLKDRGAVLPGGFIADGVYYYDSKNGNWVTSSFYNNEIPNWLVTFNKSNKADKYLDNTWSSILEKEKYGNNIVDERSFESKFTKNSATHFPYNLKELRKELGYSLLKSSPWGNTYTIDLSRELFTQEKLGSHKSTDFLMISFSSTDYIGHQFGPGSLEVLDTYVRLDRELGAFISEIEAELGKENVLFFLTSDHGVADIPEHLQGLKMPAGRYTGHEIKDSLNVLLNSKLKIKDLVLEVMNNSLYFDLEKLNNRPNLIKAQQITIEYLEGLDFVKEAFLNAKLDRADESNPLLFQAAQGFYSQRNGQIMFITNPGWVESYGNTGTSHGSGYSYDTHVPLLFYGWNVQPGELNSLVHIDDIAVTLSNFLKVEQPSGSKGKVIPIKLR